MADVLTKEQRRKNMQHIRSKDTEIEKILRKALWAKGYRYRKNYAGLPGKPDIVLTKYRIAVFCDSEFFHGKDWETRREKILQGDNGQFWVEKIERNMERDNENDKRLRFQGWLAIHFWGVEIKRKTDECVKVIEEAIFEQKLLETMEDETNFQ